MRLCAKCKASKPFSEFNFSAARGYQAYCRECQSSYDKTCSSPERIRLRNERRQRLKIACQEWVLAYLLEHPCVDCGEPDPVVLDFDHLGEKVDNVSTLMRLSSMKQVIAEIAKCEVRCANCHRRATAKRNGAWWRSVNSLPSDDELCV